jgi:hypothetical protein
MLVLGTLPRPPSLLREERLQRPTTTLPHHRHLIASITITSPVVMVVVAVVGVDVVMAAATMVTAMVVAQQLRLQLCPELVLYSILGQSMVRSMDRCHWSRPSRFTPSTDDGTSLSGLSTNHDACAASWLTLGHLGPHASPSHFLPSTANKPI